MKKSTAGKLKNLIYPLAFILIVILSVLYKFVLKGSGDFTIEAFKTGRTAQLSDQTAVSEGVHETLVAETAGMASTMPSESVQTVQMISIYICGEVRNPGIYEAPKGVLLNEIDLHSFGGRDLEGVYRR